MGRDIRRFLIPAGSRARLLRALSKLALKTSKDGDCTTSLGNPLQHLTVLMLKKFLLVAGLSCLNSGHHPVLQQHELVFALEYGLHHQQEVFLFKPEL